MRAPIFALVLLLMSSPSPAATPIHLPSTPGFVPNRGQAPPEVLYYASIPGGALYLTRDAIVIDTWRTQRTVAALGKLSRSNASDPGIRRTGCVLWLRFSDANPRAAVLGEDVGTARLNFLSGADASRWHVDVPMLDRAVYHDLWPGIDLVLSSARSGVTCALHSMPGAKLDQARFELRDDDSRQMMRFQRSGSGSGSGGTGAGALKPSTGPNRLDIRQLAALLADPARGRAHADVRGDVAPGVTLDNPAALVWSSFLGGSAEEIGWSVAVDSHGNPVVTGLDTSTFFPTTPGAYDTVYSGLGDVFVSKLSANGTTLLWSTFVGGDSVFFDYGYAVKLDPSDNPVITGYTRNTDYPVTPGAYDTSHNGGADVFVTKLNASGSALIWSTFLGGGDHDIGYDLDFDASGNVVVAGRTLSFDFPTTTGAYDTDADGEEDGFVAKLSANGSALLWSTLLGGSAYDGIQSVQLNTSGEPLVCGYTASPDFPGGAANGLYDIFASKFAPDGSSLKWSKLLGGSNYDYGTDLALDSHGNPVICGSTGSPDFPVTPGAYDTSYNGDDDVVAAKLSGVDGSTMWATFVGGSTPVYEIAHGVVIGAGDRPILVGTTPSSDFPTTSGAYDTSQNGGGDVFVLRLSAAGNALEWSSLFGGPGDDYGFELAKSGTGVIITGEAYDGYPVTPGAYDTGYNGDISDVFVSSVALPPGGTTAPVIAAGSALSMSVSPNPVRSQTTIAFTLPTAAATKLEIFDVAGRLCARLRAEPLGAGTHTMVWNGSDASGRPLAAGVYAVRLTAGDRSRSRQVVLLR